MARPYSINQLIEALQMLPGVGPRSAMRMAETILAMPYEDALELSRAVLRVKKAIKPCSVCFVHSDGDPCPVCSNPERDRSFICVVESADDVEAFERARSHPGVYHVLGGVINPSRGIGPDRIRMKELLERVKKGGVKEILIATDPSMEGDATASYILSQLRNSGVRVTRPARGIPMGADLDYLDGETLKHAYSSRMEITQDEE